MNLKISTLKFIGFIAISSMLLGCVSDDPRVLEQTQSDSNSPPVSDQAISGLAVPDNRFNQNYRVLMFGNSHVGGLDQIISVLLKANEPTSDVVVSNVGGGFLDQPQSIAMRENELKKTTWTHLILQGQKYSQSGATLYSTSSAQHWIRSAKSLSITPILFPEHPQRNRPSEATYVQGIHLRIADKESSCVAPVGLVWNHIQALRPELNLHAPDGNHASPLGKLLTGYVFYQVITGQDAALLPIITDWFASEDEQAWLKEQVSEFMSNHNSCPYED